VIILYVALLGVVFFGSITDRVGKFCNRFQMIYAKQLAFGNWHDRANYLTLSL